MTMDNRVGTAGVWPAGDDAMSALLAQNWRAIALRGVFAIMYGIIALLMPGATMLALVLLFAAYLSAGGRHIRHHRRRQGSTEPRALGMADLRGHRLSAGRWPPMIANWSSSPLASAWRSMILICRVPISRITPRRYAARAAPFMHAKLISTQVTVRRPDEMHWAQIRAEDGGLDWVHIAEAVECAARAAPYVHPRLIAAAVAVRLPSEMSDDELIASAENAEQAAEALALCEDVPDGTDETRH